MENDVTCRGCFTLGSACRKCSKCKQRLEDMSAMSALRSGGVCGVEYIGDGFWKPIPEIEGIKFKDPCAAILAGYNEWRKQC